MPELTFDSSPGNPLLVPSQGGTPAASGRKRGQYSFAMHQGGTATVTGTAGATATDYGFTLGVWDNDPAYYGGSDGWTAINTALHNQAVADGKANVPANFIGAAHWYDGGSWPTNFNGTNLDGFRAANIAGIANIKMQGAKTSANYQAILAGRDDASIDVLADSWPAGYRSWVVFDHEPENGGSIPTTARVEWQQACAHYIKRFLRRIISRGLQDSVSCGGLLMSISWLIQYPSGLYSGQPRYLDYAWWDWMANTAAENSAGLPDVRPYTVFWTDHYSNFVGTSSLRNAPYRALPFDRLMDTSKSWDTNLVNNCVFVLDDMKTLANAAGIYRLGIGECGLDRRCYNNSSLGEVGTSPQIDTWFTDDCFPWLAAHPEWECVEFFHKTNGPASQYAYWVQSNLSTFADYCYDHTDRWLP